MNTRDKDEWDIVLNLKIFSVNEKNIKTHSNSKHVHVQLFQFSQNSTCTCGTPRTQWSGEDCRVRDGGQEMLLGRNEYWIMDNCQSNKKQRKIIPQTEEGDSQKRWAPWSCELNKRQRTGKEDRGQTIELIFKLLPMGNGEPLKVSSGESRFLY